MGAELGILSQINNKPLYMGTERGIVAGVPRTVDITDGVHVLPSPASVYLAPLQYETLNSVISTAYKTGISTPNTAFSLRRLSSADLTCPIGTTLVSLSRDFLGLECRELNVEGTLTTSTTPTTTVEGGFRGAGGTPYGAGHQGTNVMLTGWDFMPRGGNSASGQLGGIGFSAGGSGITNGTYSSNGGTGGGLIFIVASNITGTGVISVESLAGGGSFGGAYAGGGGIIILCVESWDATVTLDVSSPLTGAAWGISTSGQVGSYAILKINTDGSLTLMVHSSNGVAADLNGQTPVHGADASIAW